MATQLKGYYVLVEHCCPHCAGVFKLVQSEGKHGSLVYLPGLDALETVPFQI
jgi:hypothetical protein